jgi:hypothetical protein
MGWFFTGEKSILLPFKYYKGYEGKNGLSDGVNLRLLLNDLSKYCQRDELYNTPQRAQRTQSKVIETLCELCVLCGERLR